MQESQEERKLDLSGVDPTVFLGFNDRNLRVLEEALSASITVRGESITLKGTKEDLIEAERVFTELILLYNRNNALSESDVRTVLAVAGTAGAENPAYDNGEWTPILYTKDAAVRPKSAAQATYFENVGKNDLTFAIGPAGTGKTFLAVAMAVAHLRDRQVSRIVLARPAVEAGESLGYLPGNLLEKVDPYLRPLYDALSDMVQTDKLQRYLATRVIEVVPLAYMRGRTMNNAFVILDEAQNTTPKQMQMFLTRLGLNSKAIVTGDITQIDLPSGTESGLIQVQSILSDIPGVAFVYLDESDVVRHRLVRDIIKAYNSFNESTT